MRLALLALLAVPLLAAPPSSAQQQRQPNIIVIVADDLGYGDLGAYGSGFVRSPNIDALAARGVRFTSGYATHPVCAPSRAGLITGRYQNRFGYEFNPVGRDAQRGMSLAETTLPQLLKTAGYRTGMIGKWHLGQTDGYYPTRRGFDEYFGMASGGSTYIVDPQPGDEFYTPPGSEEGEGGAAITRAPTAVPAKARLEASRKRFPITRNGEVVEVREYLTDAFSDEAVRFVERHKDRPFFLYLAYNAPHTPLQAPKRYVDRNRHVEDPGQRVYASMISSMDDGIGRIVAKLRETGLDRDTLIVFTSDNGCAGYLNQACSNAPLAGYKGLHLEGGVRVPYIVTWPARLPAGRVDSRPVSTLDIVPTAVAAAGARLPQGRLYDGVNLTPRLRAGDSDPIHRALYWRSGATYAVRAGDWKYIEANRAPPEIRQGAPQERTVPDGVEATLSPHGRHVMLFDLETDLREAQNLAPTNPQVTRRLKADLEAWKKGLVRPQWTSQRQYYDAHGGVVMQFYN